MRKMAAAHSPQALAFRDFLSDQKQVAELRKRFEGYTSPITNAGVCGNGSSQIPITREPENYVSILLNTSCIFCSTSRVFSA